MVKLLSSWVAKRKDKYQMRVRYKDPLTLKYRTVSIFMKKDTPQARRKALHELQKRADEKTSQSSVRDITIGELCDKYIDWQKSLNKPNNSVESSFYQLRIFYNDVGRDTIASRLTTSFFNQYFDKMFAAKKEKDPDHYKYSNALISQRRTKISNVYRFAINHGMLKTNPVAPVKLNYRRDDDRRAKEKQIKFLTDEEYQKILDYCDERNRQDYKDVIQWLYGTGMRVDEALAIEASDVYQTKDGIWKCKVTGSFSYRHRLGGDPLPSAKRIIKTKGAKTFAGNREIILQPSLVKIYQKHKNNKTKFKISGKDDFLFINQKSKWPLTKGGVNKFLHRAQKEEEIKKPVSSHIFRHTHISNLVQDNIPLNVIMARVGQADSRVTRAIYTHVTEKESDKLIDVLKNM